MRYISLFLILLISMTLSSCMIDGTPPSHGNLNLSDVMFENIDVNNSITLNGTTIYDLNDISSAATEWFYSDYFNQELNTTSAVDFSSINLENSITLNGTTITDWSDISGGSSEAWVYSDYFNQELNTTKNVRFNNMNVNDISADDITADGILGTNLDIIGHSKFGDSSTNYLEINEFGQIELVGKAKVHKIQPFTFNDYILLATGGPHFTQLGIFLGWLLQTYNKDNQELYTFNYLLSDFHSKINPDFCITGYIDSDCPKENIRISFSFQTYDYKINERIDSTTVNFINDTQYDLPSYSTIKICTEIDLKKIKLEKNKPLAVRIRRIPSSNEYRGDLVINGAYLKYTSTKLGEYYN